MRRRRALREDTSEIDLTPMIDIVFIMLIFFVVTATFVKEAGIDVNKPEAETAQPQTRVAILVAISDAGEIFINRRSVDVRSVRANIERLHAENPQGSLVIQADEGADVGLLVQVMDQARAAGVSNVAISANKTP